MCLWKLRSNVNRCGYAHNMHCYAAATIAERGGRYLRVLILPGLITLRPITIANQD